ncbi:SDR family oxidoreductase [Nocardiopsis changdeensis]|uniref:SDR family oxidoreductase n=1 Tax=Nocardiopsis changdeensis TaxID=2831969 RepID=A0ABX8BH88_9ACTN|nr:MULTISPECIES: SDR family oxidoreductase [Nocardiopsis]QUX20392.1 SDR family oxidoreductase [Nocardiopsis changdeensis]QYX36322.1 SDR family oxidoreductase [Nocardiopsis sp. MT53]
MDVTGSVALVTGANRGIGRRFVDELLARGAAKVYAAARRPETVEVRDPRVETLRLDLLDADSVAEAAARAADVTLLVNNAGIATGANLVTGDPDAVRLEFDTHFFGTLGVIRAFAPVLAANGGGAVVNVLSALSWFAYDGAGAYSAAKAAAWNMTNAVRLELVGQGTLVQGVHLGSADTDMMAGYDVPKIDPADVARASLDGVGSGALEVLVDDASRSVKAALAEDPAKFYASALGR